MSEQPLPVCEDCGGVDSMRCDGCGGDGVDVGTAGDDGRPLGGLVRPLIDATWNLSGSRVAALCNHEFAREAARGVLGRVDTRGRSGRDIERALMLAANTLAAMAARELVSIGTEHMRRAGPPRMEQARTVEWVPTPEEAAGLRSVGRRVSGQSPSVTVLEDFVGRGRIAPLIVGMALGHAAAGLGIYMWLLGTMVATLIVSDIMLVNRWRRERSRENGAVAGGKARGIGPASAASRRPEGDSHG